MYEYDEDFYRYINAGALESAATLLPVLLSALPDPVESVLDVGCGAGAWLSVWKSLGATVTGIDGEYVQASQLLIDPTEFVAADLSGDFDLQTRFTLAQSLEVAEHLPETSASKLVESLCRHADMVLFSAAPPGQGGENHINEQPYEYWRALFRQRGYHMYDPVRPGLQGNASVMPWYRYNSFLYVSEKCDASTLASLAPWRVLEGVPAADVSPTWYRARKAVIRQLPSGIATMLAVIKKSAYGVSLKRRGGAGESP